jgi:putative ABC transport system substrate-binding protein
MIGLSLAITVTPIWAQHGEKVYRIAFVHPSTPVVELRSSIYGPFFEELRKLGYVEGQNLVVELYSGEGNSERYADLARDVVQRKPDLIFTAGAPLALHLKSASATIPVVVIDGDPVPIGLAASLARPGGNITGVSVDAGYEVLAKRLALLKEAIPNLSRVSFLAPRWNWESPDGTATKEAAQRMGISLVGSVLAGSMHDEEYRRVFAAISQERVDAISVSAAAENFTRRQLIVELVDKVQLPAIYPFREMVEMGGLMAYAFDRAEAYRYASHQINQILKGAKPGEIPFYQVTKFKLVINLKTAKALGLTIPPALLARADELIE